MLKDNLLVNQIFIKIYIESLDNHKLNVRRKEKDF